MAERYTRLYSLPENQYTLGSPLLIAAGALLKDNQTGKALAQIKFKSISEKQIKAVKISITTFDISGKELEGVAEYQYLDLNVARNTEFGQKQAVTLPNAVTRSFVVKCTNVFFTDDSVWSADSDAHWDALPKQATITDGLGSLAAQYQRDTSIRSKFVPAEHQDLWCCSCGALNHESEAECHACRQRKEKLFVALNLESLDQRDREYKAAAVEKAAKQAEANKIQSAKNKKLAVITAAVIAVIVVVRLLVTNVIIPNGHYKDAVALMEAGQYTEAIAAFEALDGYRNSENKIIECKTAILDGKYNDAIALMNAGKYEEAIMMFFDLGGYKDSSQKITECITADRDRNYKNAVAQMQAGNYEKAISIFEVLDGHKDSATKISECKYQMALILLKKGKYEEARSLFLEIPNYKDTPMHLYKFHYRITAVTEYESWDSVIPNTIHKFEYKFDDNGLLTQIIYRTENRYTGTRIYYYTYIDGVLSSRISEYGVDEFSIHGDSIWKNYDDSDAERWYIYVAEDGSKQIKTSSIHSGEDYTERINGLGYYEIIDDYGGIKERDDEYEWTLFYDDYNLDGLDYLAILVYYAAI